MTTHNGPLAGLKVVEFAGIGPGPHAAMMLADMGAEIVRIEREGAQISNPVLDRARHRLQLDVKSEAGHAGCLKALQNADVLIEGFRPGVMERLGLGPEEMLAHNSRLIYARMTGWGQEGPLAKAAGHDINYIAITGALDACGKKGEPAMPPQNLLGDFGGGSTYCAFGIVAALYERERSGRGQVVDAAIVDGTANLLSLFVGAENVPSLSTARGEGLLSGAAHFYRCYECADGRELAVGAIEPQFYAELLKKVEAPAALELRQMDASNWDQYADMLEALFKTKTAAEWSSILDGSDACAAPVLTLEEARSHPHMKAREAYQFLDGQWHTAPAPKFGRTPGAIQSGSKEGANVVDRWNAG